MGTTIESSGHTTDAVPVLWEQSHRHARKGHDGDDLVAVPWLRRNMDNRRPCRSAGTSAFHNAIGRSSPLPFDSVPRRSQPADSSACIVSTGSRRWNGSE